MIRKPPAPTLTSRCDDYTVRGDKKRIIRFYEELAEQAPNPVDSQKYKQYAEHYRRLAEK